MKTLFAALAMLAGGLAGALPAQAQAPREVTYVYSGPTSYYWDIFIAQERGYLKEEGVKLDLIMTDNVAQQTQMLVTGAVQIIGANAEVALTAMEKGAPITIVGALSGG